MNRGASAGQARAKREGFDESRWREDKILECSAQVAEWLMAADCKSAAPWSYGGSNPPLCTRSLEYGLEGASMRFEGGKRKLVALAGLLILAVLAWQTMDPGRVRLLVFVLLGGFALRIALTAGYVKHDRARYDGTEHSE